MLVRDSEQITLAVGRSEEMSVGPNPGPRVAGASGYYARTEAGFSTNSSPRKFPTGRWKPERESRVQTIWNRGRREAQSMRPQLSLESYLTGEGPGKSRQSFERLAEIMPTRGQARTPKTCAGAGNRRPIWPERLWLAARIAVTCHDHRKGHAVVGLPCTSPSLTNTGRT